MWLQLEAGQLCLKYCRHHSVLSWTIWLEITLRNNLLHSFTSSTTGSCGSHYIRIELFCCHIQFDVERYMIWCLLISLWFFIYVYLQLQSFKLRINLLFLWRGHLSSPYLVLSGNNLKIILLHVPESLQCTLITGYTHGRVGAYQFAKITCKTCMIGHTSIQPEIKIASKLDDRCCICDLELTEYMCIITGRVW